MRSLEISIAGEALQLAPDASLSLQFNSPFYFGGNINVLPGSYSLPFTVKLTPTNRRLLGYPDLLDSAELLRLDLPAEVAINGARLVGELGVQRATNKEAQIFVIVNSLAGLSATKLTELHLGGDRQLERQTAVTAAAFYTTRNEGWVAYSVDGAPEGILTPEDDAGWNPRRPVNYQGRGTFRPKGPFTPFARIDYLLEQIAESIGYKLINNWQTSDELRGLTLWNNRLLFDLVDGVNVWPTSFNLTNHVPDVTCAEFLKWICRTFNLVPLVHGPTQTITIQKAGEIALLQGNVQDWTASVDDDHDLATETNTPRSLRYPDLETERLRSDVPTDVQITQRSDVQGTGANGRVFTNLTAERTEVTAEALSWRGLYATSRGNQPAIYKPRELSHYRPRAIINVAQKDDIELPLGAIYQYAGQLVMQGEYVHEAYTYEVTDTAGDEPITTITEVDSTETDDLMFGLAFFRGNRKVPEVVGGEWFGSVLTTNPDGSALKAFGIDARHSLELHGPQGVFEMYHAAWWRHVARRRIVNKNLVLPPAAVNQFTFGGHIRIANQLYLVRKLTIAPTATSRVLAKAQLIATI